MADGGVGPTADGDWDGAAAGDALPEAAQDFEEGEYQIDELVVHVGVFYGVKWGKGRGKAPTEKMAKVCAGWPCRFLS